MVVSSALRIYLHVAFLMREGGGGGGGGGSNKKQNKELLKRLYNICQ